MSERTEIAFVADEHEAAMIQALLEQRGIPSLQQQVGVSGPQVGFGLLNPGGGARRIMVHQERVAEARAALMSVLAEDQASIPEPVNAEHLADAGGRRPRSYGLIGGYVRAYLWSLGAISLAFAVFVVLRAV
jgi:Putative prokaryotic signal transducing protein